MPEHPPDSQTTQDESATSPQHDPIKDRPPPPPVEDEESSLSGGETDETSADRSGQLLLHRLKPRWQRSERDEADYFKVKVRCLGCDAECRIKMNDQHRMLRCRNCGTIMHLDQTGAWKRGPAPSLLQCGTEQQRQTKPSRPSRLVAAYGKLVQSLPILNNPLFLIVAGLLIVVGLGSFAYLVSQRGRQELPATLRGRAEHLCHAAIDSERKEFLRVADPDASAASEKLYDHIRERLAKIESQAGRPTVLVKVKFQKPDQTEAAVQATFIFTPRGRATKVERTQLDYLIFWKTNENGEWVIDADRSLKSAQSGGV